MKHKLIFLLLALVLVLSVAIPGCAAPEEKHAIFTWDGWTGTYLQIYVPKILLEEELGYTTEIADLSVVASWAAIGIGEADLFVDVWIPSHQDLSEKYADTTVELNLLYPDCLRGFFVPKWVSEQYGITKTTDLNDPEIAKMFDTDGDRIGDLLGCDAVWTCAERIDEVLARLGVDTLYEQKYGAEVLIRAAIIGHMKKNEPVLFYLWVPHTFWMDYPIGESVIYLEDPEKYWGGGADNVYTYANTDWVGENPEAAELIRQIKMTTVDINWAMVEIDERGDTPEVLEQIAREWMAANQAEVDSWLAAIK